MARGAWQATVHGVAELDTTEWPTLPCLSLSFFKKKYLFICLDWVWDLWSSSRELQLLSPRATTTEVWAPYSPSSTTREATAMRSLFAATKSSTYSQQLEKKACAAVKTQCGQKQINKGIRKMHLKNDEKSGLYCPESQWKLTFRKS